MMIAPIDEPAGSGAVVPSSHAWLAEAFRQHSRAVHGVAYAVTMARVVADEVTAEVFVLVGSNPGPHRFAGPGLRAHLCALGRHRALLRAAASTDVAGSDHRLLAVPSAQREAVALAYFGGLSCRDVAGILGMPEGTVKSTIRQGLQALRPLLIGAQAGDLGAGAQPLSAEGAR